MVLLFYVDESDYEHVGFHLGILASGEQVSELESALDDLVREAYQRGVCEDPGGELHAKDLVDRKRDWKHADVDDTIIVYEEALTLLASVEVDVVPRGIDLIAFQTRYAGRDDMDAQQIGFENLTERLNERLEERGELALIIADQKDKHMVERLRRKLQSAKRSSTGGGYRRQQLTQIVDTVHFVDSRESRLIQLTDLATYVVRRRKVKNPESDDRMEAVMAKLEDLVVRRIPPGKRWWYDVRR